MRAIDLAANLCPKADRSYLIALDGLDDDLRAYGLYDNSLRFAHFFARVFAETGGLRVLVENLRYTTAARIRAVWPSRPEAVAFVGNPVGLGNSVYANRMGNGPPSSGDGHRYRGRGPLQMTGKDAYREAGEHLGIDLLADPDAVLAPEIMFRPALLEWRKMGCNALADRNMIKAIGNAINRGDPKATRPPIGFADQVEWFNRIWRFLQSANAAPIKPSWQVAEPDDDVAMLQRALVAAGYAVEVDGRKGPETTRALKAFQRSAGLSASGVGDTATRAALAERTARAETAPREAMSIADSARPPIVEGAAGKGVGLTAGGGAGEMVLGQAEKIEPLADAVPWLRIVVAAVTCAGVVLILYGIYRQFRPRPGAPS